MLPQNSRCRLLAADTRISIGLRAILKLYPYSKHDSILRYMIESNNYRFIVNIF
jgi:hypothetical protein